MDKKPHHPDKTAKSGRRGVVQDASDRRDETLRVREEAAAARELAASSREMELDDREEEATVRDEALRVRAEVDEVRTDREQLLSQTKDANERLVLATMQADELAEVAAYNEERFRSLVAASSSLVWSADPNGRVQVDAGSWQSFTGAQRDAAIDPAWQWLESVHPADRDRARAAWAHAVATNTTYHCEHRLRAGDQYISVVSRAVPIIRRGVVREWIGMMTDITERVRIEEAREQFIGILGHDLRNPLGAISLGAHVLEDAPEPYGAVAARITKSARRMGALIGDVMDFARGRLGGGIPVTLKECDLRRICDDVIAEMQQAHPSRDLDYTIEGDLRGECDVARLEQVLSNLIGNAIAHGTDPIRVRVRGEDDEISLEVANQGRPIPEHVITTLFEPFARGTQQPDDRASSHGVTEGLGLGLYIVREIIRAHGGTIAVTSSAAEGTKFTARWPRSAEARARRAAKSST